MADRISEVARGANVRLSRVLSAFAAGAVLAAGLAVSVMSGPAVAQSPASRDEAKSETATQDLLIFRDGRTMTGTIVSESDTVIRFKGMVGTSKIPFETDYQKSDILEIKRGSIKVAEKAGEKSGEKAAVASSETPGKREAPTKIEDAAGKQKYYWVELHGEFGEQISQTPLRDTLKNAAESNADVIIFHLDAAWTFRGGDGLDAAQTGDFQGLFRAESMIPAIVTELPAMYRDKGKTPPRVVMWVRRAMGGAAFLPLCVPEIYFHPDGSVGGIGNLSTMMQGHERVVEKQISLRLGHMVGWFNKGGYDTILGPGGTDLIARAMTRIEQVLSVKFENGRPVFLERMPEDPSEELLTDDGREGNQDTLEAIARNQGNDVLTLKAPMALKLGISRGTVETRSDLLAALGLDRTGVESSGRSEQIINGWARGLDDAKREIKRLRDEFEDIRVDAPGGPAEMNKADGRRIQVIERIIQVCRRYGEGIPREWWRENGGWIVGGWNGQDVDGLAAVLRTRQDIFRQEMLKRRR